MKTNPRSMALFAVAVSCGSCLVSCVSNLQLRAASGGTVGRVQQGPYALTASVNAWSAGRSELRGHVVPIWVKLTNASSRPVRVAYSDLGFVDDGGFRYAPIDPKTGEAAGSRRGSAPERPEGGPGGSAERSSPWGQSSLVFDAEPWRRADVVSDLSSFAGSLPFAGQDDAPSLQLIPAWSDVPSGPQLELVRNRGGSVPSRGAYVAPTWGYPGYGYPWGYSSYYWGWGWPYYGRGYYGPYDYYWYDNRPPVTRAPTTATMVNVGLAEGDLRPNGTATGFVYFPGSIRRANPADVTWDVHSLQGEPLAELRTRFEWVEP